LLLKGSVGDDMFRTGVKIRGRVQNMSHLTTREERVGLLIRDFSSV